MPVSFAASAASSSAGVALTESAAVVGDAHTLLPLEALECAFSKVDDAVEAMVVVRRRVVGTGRSSFLDHLLADLERMDLVR